MRKAEREKEKEPWATIRLKCSLDQVAMSIECSIHRCGTVNYESRVLWNNGDRLMSKQQKGNYAVFVKWQSEKTTLKHIDWVILMMASVIWRVACIREPTRNYDRFSIVKTNCFLVFAKRFSAISLFLDANFTFRTHSFVCYWSSSNVEQIIDFTSLVCLKYFKWKRAKRDRETEKPTTSESEATAQPQRHIPCITEKKNKLQSWQCAYQTVIPVLLLLLLPLGMVHTVKHSNAWQSLPFVRSMTQWGREPEPKPKPKRFTNAAAYKQIKHIYALMFIRSLVRFLKMIKKHFHPDLDPFFFPNVYFVPKSHMCTATWFNFLFIKLLFIQFNHCKNVFHPLEWTWARQFSFIGLIISLMETKRFLLCVCARACVCVNVSYYTFYNFFAHHLVCGSFCLGLMKNDPYHELECFDGVPVPLCP